MNAVINTSNIRSILVEDDQNIERLAGIRSARETLQSEAQGIMREQQALWKKAKENEQELLYYRKRLTELVSQRTEQLEKQCSILKSANANLAKELFELRQANLSLPKNKKHLQTLDKPGKEIVKQDADDGAIRRLSLSCPRYWATLTSQYRAKPSAA